MVLGLFSNMLGVDLAIDLGDFQYADIREGAWHRPQ